MSILKSVKWEYALFVAVIVGIFYGIGAPYISEFRKENAKITENQAITSTNMVFINEFIKEHKREIECIKKESQKRLVLDAEHEKEQDMLIKENTKNIKDLSNRFGGY